MQILCFGGGKNSTALLAGMKERDERPDAILFSDTGGERPETYEHIEWMQGWCIRAAFPVIEIVRQKLTLEQDCLNRETLPSKAFGFGTCSERFKIQPQRTWVKERGLVGKVCWIVGIHYGEQRRAKRLANDHGEAIRYPLIHWQWGQVECEEAIRRNGMPMPEKSSCFYCPAMRKAEVIAQNRKHPELSDRAVAMERAAKEAGTLTQIKGLGRHWSWEGLLAADEAQQRLFADEQPPLCDVCVDY
jgi:3'-phosphoadenosine 5'-phosphosulfate sulfotransferase (PAPS reductase)/FAD synthetase